MPATTSLDDSNILWSCLAVFLDFSIGSLTFWASGCGLMFGLGTGLFGGNSFFFNPGAAGPEGQTLATVAGQSVNFGRAFLIFQTVFAATAATITAAAMAERTKFIGYLVYSIIITAAVYPIFGHRARGELLQRRRLAGMAREARFRRLCRLHGGPLNRDMVCFWRRDRSRSRLGKYGPDGKARPIPGHNVAMGALWRL